MGNHSFLFSPGSWYGEGKISLSMVEEELLFTTLWTIQPKDFAGKVACTQEIQIQGLADNMRNELTFFQGAEKHFSVDMENPNLGRVAGTGIVDEKTIAWEFRNNDLNFEGYESYQLQSDGSYLMKGEYLTTDQFRTQIEAKLWPRASESGPEEGGESR
jgi:hypothetical protein